MNALPQRVPKLPSTAPAAGLTPPAPPSGLPSFDESTAFFIVRASVATHAGPVPVPLLDPLALPLAVPLVDPLALPLLAPLVPPLELPLALPEPACVPLVIPVPPVPLVALPVPAAVPLVSPVPAPVPEPARVPLDTVVPLEMPLVVVVPLEARLPELPAAAPALPFPEPVVAFPPEPLPSGTSESPVAQPPMSAKATQHVEARIPVSRVVVHGRIVTSRPAWKVGVDELES